MIPRLKVDFFNPVVTEWDEKAYQKELYEREHCDFCLFVITPLMEGYYGLAEVIDDSYKKTDRTIFCYLHREGEYAFSPQQIQGLQHAAMVVKQNGGLVFDTLQQVIDYLNQAEENKDNIIAPPDDYFDVFISYGRRYSLDFAIRLHDALAARGFKVWLDKNSIPLGVDFMEQIDEGIKRADNFLFLISPHSVRSEYCQKEIQLALSYRKRVVTMLHVMPDEQWDALPQEIRNINWVPAAEKPDFQKPLSQWQAIDDFAKAMGNIEAIFRKNQSYVHNHTLLLDKALKWKQSGKNTNRLLVGRERKLAEKWLLTDFPNELPPCKPTDIQAEYICESKKNAYNLQTDVCLLYSVEEADICQYISDSLSHKAITSRRELLEKGQLAELPVLVAEAVERATYVLYVCPTTIASQSVAVQAVEYADKFSKPLVLLTFATALLPKVVEKRWKTIDFGRAFGRLFREKSEVEQADFFAAFTVLLQFLQKDAEYLYQHKALLVQALRWARQNQNLSMLLRGHNLDKAKTWLRLGQQVSYKPTELHRNYIDESDAKSGMLRSEVFISYSRTDGDFARKMNEELQLTGKTTWFDQESIAAGADFQKEIYNGIENSDNFLFVISPEAVQSPYCSDEVAFARNYNKRIITVLSRPTQAQIIPEELRRIQWIDFTNRDFYQAFNEVVRTLETDRDYVQKHTRYLQMATEWNHRGRHNDLLIKEIEYPMARDWLKEAFGGDIPLLFANRSDRKTVVKARKTALTKAVKSPVPTELQIDYIIESENYIKLKHLRERKTIRRLRVLLATAACMMIAAIVLGLVAYREKQIADSHALVSHVNTIFAQKHRADAETLRDSVARQNELIVELLREKGFIYGRITDAWNEPVEQVKVSLYELTEYTDAEGNFMLRISPSWQGDYHEIRVEKTGYIAQTRTVLPLKESQVAFKLVPDLNYAYRNQDIQTLRRESDRGNTRATYLLAKSIKTSQQAEYERLIKKAASEGHAASQYELGLIYKLNAKKSPSAYNEAQRWLAKAADQGHTQAMVRLANLLREKGGNDNQIQAAELYRKAALKGDSVAMNNYANCLEHGIGVRKNRTEALKWYKEAFDNGFENALEKYRDLSGNR